MAALLLAGCSGGPPLSEVAVSDPTLAPSGNGEYVNISYAIGQPAQVWVYLVDEAGTRYMLRDGEERLPSADPYVLRFDGTVATGDPVLKRRLLPSGEYTYVVRAVASDGTTTEQQGRLTIASAEVQPPLIENLTVFPETISPNADGVDDVAEITYQLPVTATVDITFSGPSCVPLCPFVTEEEAEPTPQRHVWNGKRGDGSVLEDGAYTYTIRAADAYGNVAERTGTITIVNSGQPEATITYSYIAPQAVMLGEVITVTMRVKNTGDVPIRTYGPPSGYEYSTREVFSSIEEGQYDSKPGGFWRVGVDWDANSGGARRYPFRWAISPRPPEAWKVPFEEDVLMPGEEAEVIGRIKIEQPETRMSFYTGLIWDGVGFRQDKTGRTLIEVGF